MKEGARVYLDGVFDAPFSVELAQRGARTVTKVADADLVFVALDDAAALAKLGALRARLRDDAAVWAVWPKGRPALKEAKPTKTAKKAKKAKAATPRRRSTTPTGVEVSRSAPAARGRQAPSP